jgi:tubulin beta
MSPVKNYHTECHKFLRSFPPFSFHVLPASRLLLRAEIMHMQAGQCGNQTGTKSWDIVCAKNGISGGGDFISDNDAQLDRINVLCHAASGGKYVPRAVPFDPEPGVIDSARASPLGDIFCPKNIMNQNAGVDNN